MNRRTLCWTAIGCLAGAAILFCFPPDQYRFYPRCLLHTVTGLQCPGCGGLRAAHHLLHGEIVCAFRLNPLLVVLLPVLALVLLAHARIPGRDHDWLRFFRRPVWPWLLVTALVVFGILRNVWQA